MKASVIISTYNSPEWLKKVIWGYEVQDFSDFELIIADDGSRDETRELIEKFAKTSSLKIVHVWHEDNGFQKSEILNKAVLKASTDYLIFSDGDCIPKRDFVRTHIERREIGYFLSGGYFMLPMSLSEAIVHQDIASQNIFDIKWLYEKGLEKTYKSLKLTSEGTLEKFLNSLTPTKATWNGHNASGWKDDILKINGYDERMQYGGQDRELGERLFNIGIKSKQIRYSAICVHLDHARGYKTEESIQKNRNIRKKTREEKVTWTEFGIKKAKFS